MKPKLLLLLMSTILLHGIVTAQNSVSENEARMPLGEVESYIGEHGHLPQMPSAAEVEAYNLAGRKVHTQRVPQGTLAVTLDVGRWPAGTYLLRIHTPLGATVKKLTVTR